jgi:hypothetical protein
VTEGCRKLRRVKSSIICLLFTRYYLDNKIKGFRWAGHGSCIREIRNAYNILVEKYEGKRPLVRPSCRWEHNIKIVLRKIEWEGVDWIHLAQHRVRLRTLVNTVVMNLRVPYKTGNFLIK